MADPDVKWDATQFRAQFAEGNRRNLARAGRALRDEVKRVISKQGAPTGQFAKNPNSKKGGRKQRRTPSAPGEPPHRWTGRLMRGVTSKLRKFQTVRVSARGGNLMEFGTRKMAARPFLRPTLAKMRDEIRRILTTPIKTK